MSAEMPATGDFSPIDFRAELNDEQYAAVTAPDGPALVLAGAGSGKTRTLTYRVAYLLTQGISPGQILLLTFTNKAAREMLKRVEELTGIAGYKFWGGTFHHIGQKTLRIHGSAIGVERNYTILDEGDAESLLGEVIRERDAGFLKKKDNPKARVIRDLISYARNTRLGLGEVISQRHPWMSEMREQLAGFAQAYRQRKRERQLADYDDLLELWLELLQQEDDVRTYFQNRFKHILVDEYQDTNRLQAEIIDTLGAHHQIMAVGDDAQCIYTWRGADYDNIMSFPDRHPGTVIHKIETNYRSTPQILDLANGILATQPPTSGYRKELRAVRPPRVQPYVVPVLDGKQQAQFLLQRLEGLLDEGFSYKDIGVLYRAHYHALDVQLELSRRGLPFVITSGVKFFEQAHIRDLVAHLRFVANPQDAPAFTRLVALLPGIGARGAEKLYTLAHETARKHDLTPAAALVHPDVVRKVPKKAQEDWPDFAQSLADLDVALNPRAQARPDLFAEDAQPTSPATKAEPKTPAEVVRLAVEGWYDTYLRREYPNWQQRSDDLESLVGFAQRFDDMTELLAQLVLLNSETSDRGVEVREDALRLTTIHQAKGLEYPVVFVLGLGDGMFPTRRAIENDDLDEERRLFYVAVTRAQDELYLCYPMIQTQGGGAMHMQPSRFLQALPKEHYELLRLPSSSSW